jgi:protein subunit release factor A
MERIKTEIERLQEEYDNDEDVRRDLLDEISDLEDELTEYENKIDVYNIIPDGEHYDTTRFIVIDAGLGDREYAVGTESEMESSAYDSVDSLLDDIGYEGYHKNFVMNYIDTDEVVSYFRDFYEEDAVNEPDAYVDEEDRMLSDKQEDQITLLRKKIERIEMNIERLESEFGGEDDDEIQIEIDELNDEIEELNEEISDIESSPEGDFPEDKIEEAIEDRLRDVRRDPASYINDFGLNYDNFINRRSFIQDVIDSDGYGNVLNGYDGTADEQKVRDEWYYVMRIN